MNERFDSGEPGAFTFKTPETAQAFDYHVREQLPWYDLATGVVAHFARHFIATNSTIIDIGASTGNIGRALLPTIVLRNANFIALDNSEAMVDKYAGPGTAVRADAETFNYESPKPDLVIAFLVLMFIHPAERLRLVERIKRALRPGGAFIVFDKREPCGGEIGQMIYRLTLAAKYENGAPPDEIIRKELSLAGVQRPLSEREMRDFTEVFRFGDFSGWVYAASKPL